MTNYLLPCSCGRRVSVTSSMAGEQVRCACGSELEVPTLRELKQLTQDDSAGPTTQRRAWTDRQRAVFLLLVIGLAAGAVAGFLVLKMPEAPQQVVVPVDQSAIEASSPDQIHSAFEELKKGLKPAVNMITPEGRDALEQRKLLTWGVRIALAVGACSLLAAAATLAIRPRAAR